MPLLRIQRYALSGTQVVDYFITEGSFDAGGQSVFFQLNPSLFPTIGKYAIIRTTGSISNLATPVGTAAWVGGSHPSGYSVSAPEKDVSTMSGTQYNVLYVTVSA